MQFADECGISGVPLLEIGEAGIVGVEQLDHAARLEDHLRPVAVSRHPGRCEGDANLGDVVIEDAVDTGAVLAPDERIVGEQEGAVFGEGVRAEPVLRRIGVAHSVAAGFRA